MAKKGNKDAKRAQKKHQKDVKRRKDKAQKAAAAAGPQKWHPSQGILALAVRQKTSFEVASREVSAMVAAGRIPAELLWTRERVEALDDAALFSTLARAGITTDPDDFLALAAQHDGPFDLAMERWFDLTDNPVDSDLAPQGAFVLWSRLCPARISMEALDDLAERAGLVDPGVLADEALDLWMGALEAALAADPAELQRSAELLCEEVLGELEHPARAWSAEANARALKVVEEALVRAPSAATRDLHERLLWREGRAAEVVQRGIGEGAPVPWLLQMAWLHLERGGLEAAQVASLRDRLLQVPQDDPFSKDVEDTIDALCDWLEKPSERP